MGSVAAVVGLEGRVVPKVAVVGRDPAVVPVGTVFWEVVRGVLGETSLDVVVKVPVEAEAVETETLAVVVKEVRGVWVVGLVTVWLFPGEEGPAVPRVVGLSVVGEVVSDRPRRGRPTALAER